MPRLFLYPEQLGRRQLDGVLVARRRVRHGFVVRGLGGRGVVGGRHHLDLREARVQVEGGGVRRGAVLGPGPQPAAQREAQQRGARHHAAHAHVSHRLGVVLEQADPVEEAAQAQKGHAVSVGAVRVGREARVAQLRRLAVAAEGRHPATAARSSRHHVA